jgi:hypothetical protein
MKRDHFLFLVGGLAFGVLIGFGSYHAIHTTPSLDPALSDDGATPSPRSPARMGGSPAAAPMVPRIAQLKRALEQNPDDDRVLLALANLHYDAAMWQQAAAYYERAVELEPNADVLTDLGVCYRELREFDRALETFARAHELDSGHWQSLYNTVVVATFDVGRFDLATSALEAMEAFDPRPPELDQVRLDQLREAVESLASGAGGPS